MLVDYYQILDIDTLASNETIKAAFKKQALRWHPDRNIGVDTTKQMQLINEAKLILLDSEARIRYDVEYSRFKKFQQEKKTQYQNQTNGATFEEEKAESFAGYTVDDEVLNKWMDNAKRQAVDLAKQTIEDLKGMVKEGTKAAVKEGFNYFLWSSVISIFFFILFRTCH